MTDSFVSQDGRPLLVVATPEEAQHLPNDFPMIVTGIGKLNAAVATSSELFAARAAGIAPSVVINIGTAGSLGAPAGVHRVRRVVVHDFSVSSLGQETDASYPALDIPGAPADGMRLATGDRFIEDAAEARRIGELADLVDMEGYAVAMVCTRAGVPLEMIKMVSDSADEDAAAAWHGGVEEASRVLARWLENYRHEESSNS